jgi:hypothetical protein
MHQKHFCNSSRKRSKRAWSQGYPTGPDGEAPGSASTWVQRSQERALASLICTSPESIEAFIKFCMTESAALLRPREHIVRAMTAELLVRRTMNGDQVDTIIMQAVAAKALADEHARRAAWRRTEESVASFVADEQA